VTGPQNKIFIKNQLTLLCNHEDMLKENVNCTFIIVKSTFKVEFLLKIPETKKIGKILYFESYVFVWSLISFFLKQGCGSGLDPDSVTLWIRIRIGNPDPGARKWRNFSGKRHFLVMFLKKFTTKKV
jgi:hypothetical protein